MQCIEVLEDEHHLLLRLLSALEDLLDAARDAGTLDAEAACDLLGLFEAFADGSHQLKEERHLFPRLLLRCTRRERQRILPYFGEHREERRRFALLRRHLEGAAYADPTSLDLFVLHARGYVALHRSHLAREGAFVLPLAARRLQRMDDLAVVAGFRAIDASGPDAAEVEGRLERLLGTRIARAA